MTIDKKIEELSKDFSDPEGSASLLTAIAQTISAVYSPAEDILSQVSIVSRIARTVEKSSGAGRDGAINLLRALDESYRNTLSDELPFWRFADLNKRMRNLAAYGASIDCILEQFVHQAQQYMHSNTRNPGDSIGFKFSEDSGGDVEIIDGYFSPNRTSSQRTAMIKISFDH